MVRMSRTDRGSAVAKVRVYELAKEFGVESKAVMAKLQEMGEFVRSASSTIEAPVVRRLKEAFASQAAAVRAAAAVSAEPAPVAAVQQANGRVAAAAPEPAGPPADGTAATAPAPAAQAPAGPVTEADGVADQAPADARPSP